VVGSAKVEVLVAAVVFVIKVVVVGELVLGLRVVENLKWFITCLSKLVLSVILKLRNEKRLKLNNKHTISH